MFEQLLSPLWYLQQDVCIFNEISKLILDASGENGGILGISSNGICFERDWIPVHSDMNAYIPNVEYLNAILRQWKSQKIRFCGIAHSHLQGNEQLSRADIEYARKILSHFPIEHIVMMIVTQSHISRVKITCYVVDLLRIKFVFSATKRDIDINNIGCSSDWQFTLNVNNG